MIVDVNVSASRWPFRRLPCDEPRKLVEKLRQGGVAQAWTGSFDGLLHTDLVAVNARLAETCEAYGKELLVPFGSVNPMLPDWPEDLRRCHEVHRMPGIRLHPNYHGYTLDAPVFTELLAQVRRRDLVVALAVEMEDERTQHPLVRVAAVDLAPLPQIAAQFPEVQFVVLNGLRTRRSEVLTRLAKHANVSFDIAMLEGTGGIGQLRETFPDSRILFGSHFPFYYLEAALLKLEETPLSDAQRMQITQANAARVLGARA
jgi:predicted TIM-barrel fold metal-dependent hydrolase